ncbi:hypothetical protein EVAR_51779_1 [Eumeta japonica]|uniref:Uncharacterized protein n=1 Tax=Eumeta variegata TaxID=151549 RepID=A0A4C1XDG5_EUMVA|nr:hypothetical protein EVAR_51779_1 [Eumeta japonica]
MSNGNSLMSRGRTQRTRRETQNVKSNDRPARCTHTSAVFAQKLTDFVREGVVDTGPAGCTSHTRYVRTLQPVRCTHRLIGGRGARVGAVAVVHVA